MTYIELKRKQNSLRRELRLVEQDICALEEGHTYKHYIEWSDSGQECSKCGRRIKELCHYVNCECNLPHSTDK